MCYSDSFFPLIHKDWSSLVSCGDEWTRVSLCCIHVPPSTVVHVLSFCPFLLIFFRFSLRLLSNFKVIIWPVSDSVFQPDRYWFCSYRIWMNHSFSLNLSLVNLYWSFPLTSLIHLLFICHLTWSTLASITLRVLLWPFNTAFCPTRLLLDCIILIPAPLFPLPSIKRRLSVNVWRWSSLVSTACDVWLCPQPGGDPAEAQRGACVVGAGDGGPERRVRDERRTSRPHPWKTDAPHRWRPGEADYPYRPLISSVDWVESLDDEWSRHIYDVFYSNSKFSWRIFKQARC